MRDTVLEGRFRLTEPLGSGGMGEVWAALDERMHREVAIKLVQELPGIGGRETALRFQREVRSAGSLSHRNIVTVHDWGEATVDGHRTLFMVMERLRGESLGDVLDGSSPDWRDAVEWASSVALALELAHSRGIIHRDIKPANVLLTSDGTVKVLDFGIAKFVGDTLRTNELTKTGRWIGTPAYMSPEQARGDKTVDHRTDLYSLGCLLYRAVTGQLPFNATSDFVLMRKHIDDDPVPPSELAPDIPEALNDLIGDLLRKSPDDRPESAEALHARLRDLLPRDTEEQANAHAARIVEQARAEADALYERARREVAELFRAARSRADELVRSAEEQIPESRAVAAEALLSEANPYASFSPFWFAVPVTRPLYAEDGSPTPMAKLAPGTWYLAVEQRGQALVAQTQDGRRGILRDTSGIQRG